MRNLSFCKIPEVLLFQQPVAIFVPQSPLNLIGPEQQKMVLPDVLHCRFVHRHAKNVYFTQSKCSWPDDSKHTNFSPLRLSWAEQSLIHRQPSRTRNGQKSIGLFFAALNNNCSPQDRWTEAILVRLEPSDHENSEYVRKNFIACLWTKWQCKTSEHFIKSICDQISLIFVQSGLLGDEISAMAPDKRTH